MLWRYTKLGNERSGRHKKEICGYRALHYRLEYQRGKAALFPCSHDCLAQAQEWEYNHEDLDELIGTGYDLGKPYSLDLSNYSPSCKRCHRGRDSGVAA